MERLTEVENGTAMVKGCSSNCKYGFEHCRKEDWENCKTIDDVIDKLAEYENLEEQGLLVRLPCKVGDTLYDIRQDNVKHRRNDMVHELEIAAVDVKYVPWETWKAKDIRLEEIGKTVFFTREEAEQKLKERESD